MMTNFLWRLTAWAALVVASYGCFVLAQTIPAPAFSAPIWLSTMQTMAKVILAIGGVALFITSFAAWFAPGSESTQ